MERGVHVRLLVVDYGFGKPANRTGVALMRRELRRRGLEDRFEAHYSTFRMHSKVMTVDHALVVAGSIGGVLTHMTIKWATRRIRAKVAAEHQAASK